MIMPEQKPYRSKQDVGTPEAFIKAIERKFNCKIELDLAAHQGNTICDKYFAPKYLTAIYEFNKTNPNELIEDLINSGGNEFEVKEKVKQAVELAAARSVSLENSIIKPKKIVEKVSVANTDTNALALDSLAQDWTSSEYLKYNKFLNPEYSDIEPWVIKCEAYGKYCENYAMDETFSPGMLFLLIPASVGSNYWFEHVANKGEINFTHPRLIFKGHNSPYPKDLALIVYGGYYGIRKGHEYWRWHQGETRSQ